MASICLNTIKARTFIRCDDEVLVSDLHTTNKHKTQCFSFFSPWGKGPVPSSIDDAC